MAKSVFAEATPLGKQLMCRQEKAMCPEVIIAALPLIEKQKKQSNYNK